MTSPLALKESTEPVAQQVNGNSLSVGGPLRLNLGGRGSKIPGYKTVDISPDHDVDFRTDVSDLSMIGNGEVAEIYASHILEHFPHPRTLSVLKEWYRVLKPGGRIYVAVPDFQRAAELYLKEGMTDWVMNFLYGDQLYPEAFHYRGFTFATLASVLDAAGFRSIKRIKDMPYGLNDCSSNVSTLDSRSVSLNVEAVR